MVEIRNGEDLERWLIGKPVEWITAIRWRLGLKFLPLFAANPELLVSARDWRSNLFIPIIRPFFSNIQSLIHVRKGRIYLNFYDESRLRAIDRFVERRFSIKSFRNISIRNSIYIFSRIGDFDSGLKTRDFQHNSIDIMQSILWEIRLGPEFETLISSISSDCAALERGIDLWTEPLWLDDTPDWAVRGWETLATELTRRAPHWKTLVRWYEDRLHGDDWAAAQGRPAIPELEIARASIPDSYWKKGGKAVNEAIAALEAFFWDGVPIDDPVLRALVEHAGQEPAEDMAVVEAVSFAASPPEIDELPWTSLEAVPEQIPGAIQFDVQSDGPINLAPPTASDCMSDTPGRREDYAELREKARDLMAQGVNRLGRIKQPLERFLALDDDLALVRAPIFWSRINTFRIDLADHDDATTTAAQATEPDERILDRIVAGKLRDVVQTVNLYVAGDPILLGYDAQRLGPREAATETAILKRAAPVLKVALSNTVITVREAGEIVIEQVDIAASAPATVAGRLATDLGSKTVGNYVSTLVRRGYAPLKPYINWSGKGIAEGALREIGKRLLDGSLPGVGKTAREILVFISDNLQPLLHYASDHFGNPALQAILELIHKMLS